MGPMIADYETPSLTNITLMRLTNEGDVCGLAVIDTLLSVNPEPRQLGENLDSLECFQVVDEDVGNPKIVYQLQIN